MTNCHMSEQRGPSLYQNAPPKQETQTFMALVRQESVHPSDIENGIGG